jgi:hypothetical protein
MVIQKNLHRIPELKTPSQSEIEAISTGTLTKVVNSFAFHFYKVCDHM